MFIWLTTILCTVAYKDSWPIDQLFEITFEKLLAIIIKEKAKKALIVKYNPMLVREMCIFPKRGASKLIKFLISNWSKGLIINDKFVFI